MVGPDMFTGRIAETPMLRAATIKPSPPLLPKESAPAIVIKQGPVDKRDKARDRKDKGPTREEVLKKVNALMDDFVSHSNVEDAITAFKDLKIPERFLRHAVYTIYTNTLDRGDGERELASNFVMDLKKENVITGQQLTEGWKELVASIADKDSTVPCIASHVASITAKAIVNNLVQLQDLAAITENGQHHPLFLLTLQQLHKSQGKARLTQIFNESKINLMSQLPEPEKTKERLGEILEDRELTFLYPLLRIQGDMWRQLESDPSPKALRTWIKDNLDPAHYSDPGFINALMTVLLKYITQASFLQSSRLFIFCSFSCFQPKIVVFTKKKIFTIKLLFSTQNLCFYQKTLFTSKNCCFQRQMIVFNAKLLFPKTKLENIMDMLKMNVEIFETGNNAGAWRRSDCHARQSPRGKGSCTFPQIRTSLELVPDDD